MTVQGLEMVCDSSILRVLNGSEYPMTSSEIVTAIGLGNLPKGSKRLAVDYVRDRLYILHGRGLVTTEKVSPNRVLWSVDLEG